MRAHLHLQLDEHSLLNADLPNVKINAGGATFYFYHEESAMRNWTDARQVCQSRGLDLAMPKSANVQAALHPKLQALCPDPWYIIGGYQPEKDSPWIWVDGTPLTYTNWEPLRPDDYGGKQDCLIVWVKSGQEGLWDDTYCGDVSPFVCGPAGTTAGESAVHAAPCLPALVAATRILVSIMEPAAKAFSAAVVAGPPQGTYQPGGEVVICDGAPVDIGCGGGLTIAIDATFFGRADTTTCYDQGIALNLSSSTMSTTNCTLPNATYHLQRYCNGKTNCRVDHLAVYPADLDPCYMTYKYSRFTYACVGATAGVWL